MAISTGYITEQLVASWFEETIDPNENYLRDTEAFSNKCIHTVNVCGNTAWAPGQLFKCAMHSGSDGKMLERKVMLWERSRASVNSFRDMIAASWLHCSSWALTRIECRSTTFHASNGGLWDGDKNLLMMSAGKVTWSKRQHRYSVDEIRVFISPRCFGFESVKRWLLDHLIPICEKTLMLVHEPLGNGENICKRLKVGIMIKDPGMFVTNLKAVKDHDFFSEKMNKTCLKNIRKASLLLG